ELRSAHAHAPATRSGTRARSWPRARARRREDCLSPGPEDAIRARGPTDADPAASRSSGPFSMRAASIPPPPPVATPTAEASVGAPDRILRARASSAAPTRTRRPHGPAPTLVHGPGLALVGARTV